MPSVSAATTAMSSVVDPHLERQQMLEDNLGLVHHVARQVARSLAVRVEIDELVSAGTLGLVSAIDSFDRSRGLAFSTFAAPRIRGAMLDELRRQAPMPRSVRQKTRNIDGARNRVAERTGRPASHAEIAAEMGVDMTTLWKWQLDVEGAAPSSLHEHDDDSGDGEYVPALATESDVDEIDERLTREKEIEYMKDAMLDMSERDRTVLVLHYYEQMRLHEIADVLGLTESRVSQIRAKALTALRAKMAPLRRGK